MMKVDHILISVTIVVFIPILIYHSTGINLTKPIKSEISCLNSWHKHYTGGAEAPAEWLELEKCEGFKDRYLELSKKYAGKNVVEKVEIEEGPAE